MIKLKKLNYETWFYHQNIGLKVFLKKLLDSRRTRSPNSEQQQNKTYLHPIDVRLIGNVGLITLLPVIVVKECTYDEELGLVLQRKFKLH